MTTYQDIYNRFLGKITDDMYVSWTQEDTTNDLFNILIDSLPSFEFPRFPITDRDAFGFNADLTDEEINIIALLMLNTWLQRQITSIDNTRMIYSGTDFKMSSQANHLDKLIKLKTEVERQAFNRQRLYGRRKFINGTVKSTWLDFYER